MTIQTHKSVYAAFVDLKRHLIGRELLFCKLLKNNINGKIYKAIKLLYTKTLTCVRVNNLFTQWFDIHSGVRQGDILLSTHFSYFS